MRHPRHLLPLLVVTLAAGCSGGGTDLDGSCVAVVVVDGRSFTSQGVPVEPSTLSAEPVVTVTRNTGCLDQGEDPVELGHGESNFLAVGTPIHSIDGFDPEERLAYYSPTIDEWLTLAPAPGS